MDLIQIIKQESVIFCPSFQKDISFTIFLILFQFLEVFKKSALSTESS